MEQLIFEELIPLNVSNKTLEDNYKKISRKTPSNTTLPRIIEGLNISVSKVIEERSSLI